VLVDCGLFQGLKKLRERNWRSLPIEPASLGAVVLTHAHIDHSGYLPRLCRLGFRGPVYCSEATAELLGILLPDAGFLQEEDAKRANKYGYTRHHPAEPLFTRKEAEACLVQLRPTAFNQQFVVASQVSGEFRPTGHIVGAASVALRTPRVSVTFSGDVGRPHDPIMKPPALLGQSDYLVVESTYGDRLHFKEDVAEALARTLNETAARGGVLLVPAFAVGRAQHLLHLLTRLRSEGAIPNIPVHLDSPMAIHATEIFSHHQAEHRISKEECRAFSRTAQYARTSEESKWIDEQTGPRVIISASGMATGGRVLHHLQRFLPDERNTVLLVGYQAAGTRGRALAEGADELKIHGQYVRVRARVAQISGLSAHADYSEMLDWLRRSQLAPRAVFVTHGEPAAVDAFRRRLRDTFDWNAIDPDDDSVWTLD